MTMESIKDLNMDADEMQVVLSAIRSVNKRIKEVAQTHKPLFGGEHFLTGKEVCERLYISPRTLQDYRDRKIIPYTPVSYTHLRCAAILCVYSILQMPYGRSGQGRGFRP